MGRSQLVAHGAVSSWTDWDAALAEAVRHTREVALRQVMAMCSRLRPIETGDAFCLEVEAENKKTAFKRGHLAARMQLYDEIERMIASEKPAPDVADRDDDGDKAYDYLRRLLVTCAPQCEPLPDMFGICIQIDNLIAGYRIRLGELPDLSDRDGLEDG